MERINFEVTAEFIEYLINMVEDEYMGVIQDGDELVKDYKDNNITDVEFHNIIEEEFPSVYKEIVEAWCEGHK